MAKIGDSEFPEIGLGDSIAIARVIHDDLGSEITRDGLAVVLGMSASGGAYGARLGALRMWGLATGRSLIRLTPDGVRVVSTPDSSELMQLTKKLAASVDLFNELHRVLGDAVLSQNVLAVRLQEITGADMPSVRRRLPIIERVFGDIRQHLNDEVADVDDAESPAPVVRTANVADSLVELPTGWIEFRFDDGELRMRETPENVEVLIETLRSRLDRMRNSNDPDLRL